jgi:hypothetical protein
MAETGKGLEEEGKSAGAALGECFLVWEGIETEGGRALPPFHPPLMFLFYRSFPTKKLLRRPRHYPRPGLALACESLRALQQRRHGSR